MQKDVIVYAIGAIGLGVVGLIFGDFALQWQPVPDWVPLRTPLAYLSALIILGAGAAALVRRWALAGMATLAIFYSLWTLLLKTPAILAAPLMLGTWLGFAEIASLAIAGFLAVSLMSGHGEPRAMQGLRIGYGLCAVIFGLSHFVYVDITASMVPEWLPARHFWAYATGAGHFSAGLAILSGVLARVAATMLALMMGSFVLLVHLPDMIANPSAHLEWTILFVATTLAGAAWIVRGSLARDSAGSALSHHISAFATANEKGR